MKKRVFLILTILFLPTFQFHPFYNSQGGMTNYYSNKLKISADFDAGDKIGLTDLWDDNLTGTNVTVAILDTGIRATHDVFTNNGMLSWNQRIIEFFDVVENETTSPVDVHGHGTWAASILAGNSSEYQGVAPNVSLVILKMFDNTGETNATVLNSAIDWIINNREKYDIKIVSMSFGAKPTSDNLNEIAWIQEIVRRLVNTGVLVVAAAGNDGNPSKNYGDGTINSPASEKSVLAVGGVDYDGKMYPNSAKGPTFEGEIKPDVCAPAYRVWGADIDTDHDYSYRYGTSGSTPFVAGLAALMLEKVPSLSHNELKNIISLTSHRTINTRTIKDNIQGWGIIQGYAALDALNPPLTLNKSSEILISLNQNRSVVCLPIILSPDHYYFELTQLNNTSAEMFLFNSQPDQYGNPVLISDSINQVNYNLINKRMGAFIEKKIIYYLLIKLIGDSTGNFLLKFVDEYRNFVLLVILGGNILGLVIVGYMSIKFKKQISKN